MNYDDYEDQDYEAERYASPPQRERFHEFSRSERSGILPYASVPVRPKFNFQPIKGAMQGIIFITWSFQNIFTKY